MRGRFSWAMRKTATWEANLAHEAFIVQDHCGSTWFMHVWLLDVLRTVRNRCNPVTEWYAV